MKRLTVMFAALAAMLLFVAPANAAFGFKELGVTFEDEDGSPQMQAGAHPFVMTTEIEMETVAIKEGTYDWLSHQL